MKRITLVGFIIAGLIVAGCAKTPTRAGYLAKEEMCLQSYCASNAVTAEAALVECDRSAPRCQKAGVKDILYDEVFARTYGRLY